MVVVSEVDPRVGLGWVGLGRDFLAFLWVEMGRGSETFPKIKLDRPIYNLIMINTDRRVIPDKLSLTVIY